MTPRQMLLPSDAHRASLFGMRLMRMLYQAVRQVRQGKTSRKIKHPDPASRNVRHA
jgi:hypothetical protein